MSPSPRELLQARCAHQVFAELIERLLGLECFCSRVVIDIYLLNEIALNQVGVDSAGLSDPKLWACKTKAPPSGKL